MLYKIRVLTLCHHVDSIATTPASNHESTRQTISRDDVRVLNAFHDDIIVLHSSFCCLCVLAELILHFVCGFFLQAIHWWHPDNELHIPSSN